MASFSCRATAGSPFEAPGVREMCSTWRAIESSRWWISATSWASRWASRDSGPGLPIAEFSQSPKDIPARRADASARSRTDGSIPSTLHDTRAVMPWSGLGAGSGQRPSDPRVPLKRQPNFDARRLFPVPTFPRYGKYRVNDCLPGSEKLALPTICSPPVQPVLRRLRRAVGWAPQVSHDVASSPAGPQLRIEFRPILPHCKKMPMEGPLFRPGTLGGNVDDNL